MRAGEISSLKLVESALALAQEHRKTRAFISINPHALAEADRADRQGAPRSPRDRPLHGLPLCVKDNFDVAGLETTCGSSFYASTRKPPRRDSAYVAAWRRTGAIIVGKTHLNEFAYGLTGENQTYGDCVQARDHQLLAGGSSSGSAAAVQAGSSLLGLGTDTGGSLRVPGALCGLVSFRHSPSQKKNRGVFPLAPSFDTCGWLQRHLSDLAFVYSALTRTTLAPLPLAQVRIGFLTGNWLNVCEDQIMEASGHLFQLLHRAGVKVHWQEVTNFEQAPEIFSALQASEAARVHRKFLKSHSPAYDPAIRARLEWGRSLTPQDLLPYQRGLREHITRVRQEWQRYDFLLAPASPFTSLPAEEDHAKRRRALLQLTTPFSLAGLPALTFPWGPAGKKFGWQLVTHRGGDRRLASISKNLDQILN